MKAPEAKKRRTHNQKWQGIYGKDRAYTARVDRLEERTDFVIPAETKTEKDVA